MNEHLRDLPPVHRMLAHPAIEPQLSVRGRAVVIEAVRATLSEAREAIRVGAMTGMGPDELAARARARLDLDRPSLRPVLNATGVLLHTGLGRAPLAPEAAEAIAAVARGYCNLELDLDTGDRGRRTDAVAALLRRITGAEAAAVVNNNAAATVLALRALALGREVLVSRGQLVEIGGSFRLPEIFEASGARLREVGTTNRTRIEDYRRAIGPDTAALLRVHASNYRIVGFTESASIADLASLGRETGVWVIDDVGSGALARGLPALPPGCDEPTIADGLAAGADLVLASGDKLLGGPQCGLLVGSSKAVKLVSSDPLMRAFRVDKLTLAALEATLRLMLDPARAARSVPLWSFLATTEAELDQRSHALAERIARDHGLDARPITTTATLGGGSVPVVPVASRGVSIAPPTGLSETELARRLRKGEPAVLSVLRDGRLVFDLRALPPEADVLLPVALERALNPD
jgi:L-seryl-tRNA(Ser) seleniumtransferase